MLSVQVVTGSMIITFFIAVLPVKNYSQEESVSSTSESITFTASSGRQFVVTEYKLPQQGLETVFFSQPGRGQEVELRHQMITNSKWFVTFRLTWRGADQDLVYDGNTIIYDDEIYVKE